MSIVQRASGVGQLVVGVLLLLFGLAVGGAIVADIVRGHQDAGAEGAAIFLAGMALVGAFLSRRGVRQISSAELHDRHQHDLQFLRNLSLSQGRASAAELAVRLGLSPAEVESIAERLSLQGHVEVLISPDGVIVYEARGLRLTADDRQRAEDPLAPRVAVRVAPASATTTATATANHEDEELLAQSQAASGHAPDARRQR